MSVDDSNNLIEEDEREHEEDGDSGEGDVDDGEEGISGWADSMMKILKSTKPKNKKNLILSRARKDYEVSKVVESLKKPKFKRKDNFDFEIEKDQTRKTDTSADSEKKKDEKKDGKDDTLSLKQQRKLELRQRKLDRAWENLNRLSTETTDREMERDLLKIATKGVVQLFNAVATQQKSLKTKLRASGKSEFKKDKVMSESKDLFNKAMSKSKIVGKHNGADSDDDEQEIKEEDMSSDEESTTTTAMNKRKRKASGGRSEATTSKKPVWQALQDDFMLGAKLKDWDKDSDSD